MVGDRLGRRRIPLGSVKPKAPSTLISPTAVQGRLFVLVLAPHFRARDHLAQPPSWRSQGLRLRRRRVPEIDDVDLTWLRSSTNEGPSRPRSHASCAIVRWTDREMERIFVVDRIIGAAP